MGRSASGRTGDAGGAPAGKRTGGGTGGRGGGPAPGFPPAGSRGMVTVALPPLKEEADAAGTAGKQPSRYDSGGSGAASREASGGKQADTRAAGDAARPKQPVQHLPNWIVVLFDPSQKN